MYLNNEVGGKTLENNDTKIKTLENNMKNRENMKSIYFFIKITSIPYKNRVANMIQRRVLIGIAKGIHQSHGYSWKEVPEKNKKEGKFKITIHGSQSECESYLKKLENFGLNKANDIIANDDMAIKRILPAKLRAKLNKGIHHDKENNAMQKIQNRLLGLGIVLDYGIDYD